VKYIYSDGSQSMIDAEAGTTAMLAAVTNGVEGIAADCGGNLMCATCHVYVDETWVGRLEERDEIEDEMLDETVCARTDCSRLSCQIVLTDALDGIVLHLPEAQI